MNKNEQRLRDEFKEYNILNAECQFIEWLNDNTEFKFCDMCDDMEHTNDLIWLTADDFEPLKGEKLDPVACENLDAVCSDCYKTLLI